jgi:hypothetical protein
MGLCGQPANCLTNKRRSTRGGGASRCSLAEQKTVVSIEWRDIDNVSESFLDGISSEIYSNNNNASSPTAATAATAAAAAAAVDADKIVGEADDSKFLSSMTQVSESCPTNPNPPWKNPANSTVLYVKTEPTHEGR